MCCQMQDGMDEHNGEKDLQEQVDRVDQHSQKV